MPSLHALSDSELPVPLGFRSGKKGVHNTRTVMIEDLRVLFSEVPPSATAEGYREAIVDENVLGKRTHSTRKYTAQRLSELYGLDPTVPLFRLFRHYWGVSQTGRELLAMLLALARDPLLRLTAKSVLEMPLGTRFDKTKLQEVIRSETGERFSETSVKKISRLAGSSWTQSGHLEGRYKKTRQRPACMPANTSFALLLGYLGGARGALLFETFWARVLDAPDFEAKEHAKSASRRGLLTYRNAGGVIEVGFSEVLTEEEHAASTRE